jgi:leucyl-tRNA synthetase
MDFIQLFNSWYNKDNDKAEDVSTWFQFSKRGNATVNAVCDDKIAVLRQVTGVLLQKSSRENLYNIGWLIWLRLKLTGVLD